MSGRVAGKVAFVTGAARGQGRSHALRLAEEGADIIAIDLCGQVDSVPYPMARPADLDRTVAQVEALGRRIIAVQADVRDFRAIKVAVEKGVTEFGNLDIVAANAGICSFAAVTDLDQQAWQDMIDINLTGTFNTIKAAVPHMIVGGRGGAIVITSSAVTMRAVQNVAHYTAAKHGLIGLMRTAALELGTHNIRVNSLHPGNVDTEMIQNEANRRLFLPDQLHATPEELERIYTKLNVLPTPWVDAVDISNALLFLASDDARFITGIALAVDAGFSLL